MATLQRWGPLSHRKHGSLPVSPSDSVVTLTADSDGNGHPLSSPCPTLCLSLCYSVAPVAYFTDGETEAQGGSVILLAVRGRRGRDGV